MNSRKLDFNPAGGYLKELRARGLVRASPRGMVRASPRGTSVDIAAASSEAQLPLAKVLLAATPKRRSLSEVQQSAGLDANEVIAAVQCLSNHDLVRIVDSDEGPAVELTADGEATLQA